MLKGQRNGLGKRKVLYLINLRYSILLMAATVQYDNIPVWNGTSIFGMSIQEATARSNEILQVNDTVPRIVKTCISFIEAQGILFFYYRYS